MGDKFIPTFTVQSRGAEAVICLIVAGGLLAPAARDCSYEPFWSFDVGTKGRGLAVMHDVDEYHPKNATKAQARRLGDVDTLCVHKSPN